MSTKQRVEDKHVPGLLPTRSLKNVPWWILILVLVAVIAIYAMSTSEDYKDTFNFLKEGLKWTILITVVSYLVAMVLGLIAGLGRVSKNPVIYTIATLYVEVVRGIPMLVQLLYVAFVLVPLGVDVINIIGRVLHFSVMANLNIQDVDTTARGIIGLSFGYGAYSAEIFRAGIQSIERGQMEAARSLGMTYIQAMRYVILPQAIRRVLPPLGNDFIAMLKDSSLLSALAVRELTQLGKLNRARTFLTFETWNTVAFLYLSMTLVLSLGVQVLERRLSVDE